MKSIMILLDGIQDQAYPELGGNTPLQVGGKEAFAQFERESATAHLITSVPGRETDTLICTLILLGVKEAELPTGRSSLEALAEHFPFEQEDLILRCSFVKVDEENRIVDPCCTPPEEIAQDLMKEVMSRHQASLKRIGGYKCLQCMPGGRQWLQGLRAHPAHDCTGWRIQDAVPSGNQLAEQMAATTLTLLEQYRPYTILNWAPSAYEELPSFPQLWGMTGGMVTKTLVLEGIARAMGMDCPVVEGATGDTDTNLAAKADATLKLLEEKDFVLLHIGGADEATHRQNPVEKAEFIERMDGELLLPILEGCPNGTRIMLTSDHWALCSTSGHTDDPVHAFLWEKGANHQGDFGTLPGNEAIKLLCSDRW